MPREPAPDLVKCQEPGAGTIREDRLPMAYGNQPGVVGDQIKEATCRSFCRDKTVRRFLREPALRLLGPPTEIGTGVANIDDRLTSFTVEEYDFGSPERWPIGMLVDEVEGHRRTTDSTHSFQCCRRVIGTRAPKRYRLRDTCRDETRSVQ